ncbi:MAG TPA: hypothetical protein VLX61_16780 [Anaerolineales bacterium]|nr:hypothetical protein [Anaerolineales bacterium]
MRSLTEWENYLRSYFQRRLRLVGEIPLRRRDVEELADLIRAYFAELSQQEGMPHATKDLTNKYPHAFITFLTAFATFNEQLNYWRTLSERLDIPESHFNNYGWRHIAYDWIKKTDLPVLSEKQVSDKYISTLRFHGGIPLYSLPDFFAYVLLPSVEKAEYAELPAERALKKILDGIHNVDFPVINFLTYSGELGLEYFTSCREMARRYIRAQELVAPEELKLPAYLTEAFFNFMEGSQESLSHLRKPILYFNPYEEPNLHVQLPEEQVPLFFVNEKVYWQISWDGLKTPFEITPNLHKQRQEVLTRESSLRLENPPLFLKISLLRRRATDSPQPIRRWTLPCLPSSEQPLLAARGQGQILTSQQELPGEKLLLVFPADVQLRTEGEGSRLETYPALSGIFSDWHAEAWDLTKAQSLHLLRKDQEVCPALPIGFADQLPLLAGVVCPYNDDAKGIPLYAGHFPVVRIPMRRGRSLVDELKRWKVEIRSQSEANPILNLEVTPAAYLEYVNVSDENFADFDLAAILGENAIGTFNMLVRSQYETEAEFRFRIWPSLYVLDLDKYILPGTNVAQPISFSLRLPEDSRCEVQPGVDGITIEPSALATKIIVDEECIQADLFLIKTAENGNLLRVPISIPIPRLRWKLLFGDADTEPAWATRPIQKSADALLQSTSASVHLSMHGIHAIADRISLLLVDPEAPDNYLQEENLRISAFEKDVLRIPLSSFRTTLAGYTGSPQLELQLFYRALNFSESKRVPLAFLSRKMEVSDVAFNQISELIWRLSWTESNPLRNRRLLIESLWQPWWYSPDQEFKIPDKAQGNFILQNVALLPSHYRIAFYTAQLNAPERTGLSDARFFEIHTCTPQERVLQLENQPCPTAEIDFSRHFEICIILNEIGERYDAHLNRCLEILKSRKLTNLNILLHYHGWLEEQSNKHPEDNGLKANLMAFRSWMFTPEIVSHAIQHEKRNSPLRSSYVKMVTSANSLYLDTAKLLIEYEEDPSVINHCLNLLMETHVGDCVALIYDLVHAARLSFLDGAHILASKPQDVVQLLLRLTESNTRDSLILSWLHQIEEPVQTIDKLPIATIQQLLSIDQDQKFLKHYERALREKNETSGIPIEVADGTVKKERGKPSAINLGVVSEAVRLNTPAGIGTAIWVQRNNGEKISQARLRDEDFHVLLKLSTGEDVIIDFEKKTIRFQHGNRVYSCSNCQHFASANKALLYEHQNKEHPFAKHFVEVFTAEFIIDPRNILVSPTK